MLLYEGVGIWVPKIKFCFQVFQSENFESYGILGRI